MDCISVHYKKKLIEFFNQQYETICSTPQAVNEALAVQGQKQLNNTQITGF